MPKVRLIKVVFPTPDYKCSEVKIDIVHRVDIRHLSHYQDAKSDAQKLEISVQNALIPGAHWGHCLSSSSVVGISCPSEMGVNGSLDLDWVVGIVRGLDGSPRLVAPVTMPYGMNLD